MERQLRPDLHAAGRLEAAITPDSPRQVIDVELFSSSLLRVGRWRCPAGHQQFRDSGPASDTFIAFPRESVRIQHEGAAAFVADANTVTYYNTGQRYQRTGAAGWGDRCEWFAFEPDVIADALADHDPGARDRLDRVFPYTHGSADATSYFAQRRVFAHVSREKAPDRLFVEETMLGVLSRVSALARAGAQARPRRVPKRGNVTSWRTRVACWLGTFVATPRSPKSRGPSARRCFICRGCSTAGPGSRCTSTATTSG